MRRRIVIAVALLLLGVAPSFAQAAEGRSLGGIGANPKGALEGEPPTLPPGVEVLPIRGFLEKLLADFTPDPNDNCNETHRPHGSGGLVRVCISFRYLPPPGSAPQGTPIRIAIPGGTTVRANKIGYQHGLLTESLEVIIRPGEVINIPAFFYCLNPGLHASEPGLPYSLGPVLKDREFSKLVALTRNKAVDAEQAGKIQAIVGELSGGANLTDADKAFIQSLPDRPAGPLERIDDAASAGRVVLRPGG